MAGLLAASVTTAASMAAPIVKSAPDNRAAMFRLVQQNDAKPSIGQLKARQEARKRINKQLLILKKMQVEQLQLQVRQRKLMEQTLKRQTIRSTQRKTEARQARSRENEKRSILENARRSEQNQTAQRNEQPKTALSNQRKLQEQSIKEKYPALQSYYRSLARRTLRDQNERSPGPDSGSNP